MPLPRHALRLSLLLSLPLALHATAAAAQVPDKDQAACIVAWNKAATGITRASASIAGACVKAALKGKEPSPQACLAADPKDKVAKAAAKLGDVAQGACVGGTPFGVGRLDVTQLLSARAPREVTASLFGADLDAAGLSPGGEAAACQAAVLKASQGLLATSAAEFVACAKAGLKAGALDSAASLETACYAALEADAKGKVGKARDKVAAALAGPCDGIDIATTLRGDCDSAPSTASCIDGRVACALCRMLDGVDGLSSDCDLRDDGLDNASCATCGNGVVEDGEACDGGPCCSDTCEAANDAGACDDGDACTVGDTCSAGACAGAAMDCSAFDSACTVGQCSAGTCGAAPANDGGGCDDGDACTVDDTCSGGACAGDAMDCSSLDSACTEGECDAGACSAAPANEAGACDDGDACTDADACTDGACEGSPVPPSTLVLEDHFPGSALDSAWQESLVDFGAGWTGSVHDGILEVTDVASSTFDDWARVRLEQDVAPTGDFLATFQVSWDSASSNTPIQYMRVELLDADGQRIALAGFDDSWAANSGNYVVCGSTGCYGTGQGTKPLAGAETFLLERVDGDLLITDSSTTLLSGTNSAAAVTRLRVEFGFWRWSGGNFFGTLSTDLVRLESLNTACTLP